MALLIAYVALALLVSFVCSILEAVLLSITPAHVAVLEKEGHRTAAGIRRLKENIDRPLAAILSLNTIAHTVGAAGAGAQAARVFGSGAVGIFSAVLTLLILVGTEIVPKTLGAVHWKRLTPAVVVVLRVLVLLMLPLVWLAQWLTRLLTPRDAAPLVNREELAALADEGTREGVVAEGESRVLKNLLRLAGVRAADIMTPAEHVVVLDGRRTVGAVLQDGVPEYSRLPVRGGDDAGGPWHGYVLRDDVLERAAGDHHDTALEDLRRDLLSVAADAPLPAVFDRMLERREHIAAATDAGGRLVGIVTMEDVIETLLGLEIYDEIDDAERMHTVSRDHWRDRAARLGRLTRPRGAQLGTTGSSTAAAG